MSLLFNNFPYGSMPHALCLLSSPLMIDHLMQVWHSAFGSSKPGIIVRAPGRVNIIGEHTDYNEGWVLPGAMSRSIYILISRNDVNEHHWLADDLKDEYQSDLSSALLLNVPAWVKYVEGALRMYARQTGPLRMLIGGDLSVGAGISSSSALVCGVLYALQQLNGSDESKEELAVLGSRVEREIIGLQGGIMDQYAIMLSRSQHVMLLDCRTKKYKFITAELPECRWVLINTKVKHQLIDSDYNNRANECKRAVSFIHKKFPEVTSLRDVTLDMINEIELPDVLRMRSVYVIEENHRVHAMVDALKNQEAIPAGQLLKASHSGLRDQYQVSCDELDHLADFANNYHGGLGARMMGGGFGGCVICLIQEKTFDQFLMECISFYAERFGFEPDIIHFELGNGVECVE